MKCIIVDDEPIAQKGMKRLVESRQELELKGVFECVEETEAFLKDNEVELIFLDIEMPGVNGMQFAGRIPRTCFVVFTTAYSEYALESYEVNALDYIVKPIDISRFNRAVDKALCYSKLITPGDVSIDEEPVMTSMHIIVKADRRYVRIKLEDIVYVEGLKDYIIIHLPDRRLITRMTIKKVEETLPSDRFLRVNKSYIVNVEKIDSFDNNDVFIGTTEISIGVSYRNTVLKLLLGQ